MVNDCANVGTTLLKYLPLNFEKQHIKRTRQFWDKTFGIAYKIFKAKGDVYHANYLLQDCYIAARLGKHPLVGHAHGTDVRESIGRFFLGRIVKHNLKNCDKVLVSTPNLLEKALEYNDSSEYLPNPVDTELFYPNGRNEPEEKLKVLIAAGSHWRIKGTDKILYAAKKVQSEVDLSIIRYGIDINRTLKLADDLGLNVTVLPPVSHSEMRDYYWNADTVIGSIGIGGSLGMVALEAIACGRPTVVHVSSRFSEYNEFPLHDLSTPEEIAEALISSREMRLWEKEYNYLKQHHTPQVVIERLVETYNCLV
ncbi:MAG: glycosyltransferase family 4 protein [Candidatus Bathyarchaeota archaeon]|nr:MAG: glycosyltransferase family 4 protein [Candidatus Bathyarchaeota archaeon]